MTGKERHAVQAEFHVLGNGESLAGAMPTLEIFVARLLDDSEARIDLLEEVKDRILLQGLQGVSK